MRIQFERPILNEFFESIKSTNGFTSWSQFYRKTSTINPFALRAIRQNKRTFSKKIFNQLIKLIPTEKRRYFLCKAEQLPNNWRVVRRWKKNQEQFERRLKEKEKPTDLELKAKLCGYLAGDGSLIIRKHDAQKTMRHDIRFYPDDLVVAQAFREAFLELYEKDLKIVRDKVDQMYVLRTTHKMAALDLVKIGKFGTLEWRVPLNFLTTNSMKAEWLKAFFDCEAYVGKGVIRIQSVNRKGVLDIKCLLAGFDIESSKLYKYQRKQKNWNTNYLLDIRKKPNLEKYLRLVGFNHSKKRAKLQALVAGVAQPGTALVSNAFFAKKSSSEPVGESP